MNDKRLSKLQRRIITELGNLIVNSFGEDPEYLYLCDTKYSKVFTACADWWFGEVPAIRGERRYKTAQVAFSRAVWSLVERGVLEGVALAWCHIKTYDHIRWHGGGPKRQNDDGFVDDPRPQIKMLSFTDEGWRLFKTTRTTPDLRDSAGTTKG